MNHRENYLRAYRFQTPDYIPIASGYPSMMWTHYDPQDLQNLMATHPILFPGYAPGDRRENRVETRPDLIAGRPYTDYWGCTWETMFTGMVGHVSKHALADWENFDGYQAPNPAVTDGLLALDWQTLQSWAVAARRVDYLLAFYLPHGHTFLRLSDLRGFENLVYDMADEDARFLKLLQMLEDFNLDLTRRYIALQPDVIGVPEDLGMQDRLAISPRLYRKFIKPSYLKMTRLIKQHGILVHEHTDGYMMEIVDDLIEAGADERTGEGEDDGALLVFLHQVNDGGGAGQVAGLEGHIGHLLDHRHDVVFGDLDMPDRLSQKFPFFRCSLFHR